MSDDNLPEVWLRGPVPGIATALQPVAHALLQAREEIAELMDNFPGELLWVKPGGLASPAFHLQHMAGVIDRMITYKNAGKLNNDQLLYLDKEGKSDKIINTKQFVTNFNNRIDQAIQELINTNEETLADFRGVGRKQLPSTVKGLLFHMAEHTMRHTGQLLVTVKILKNWV